MEKINLCMMRIVLILFLSVTITSCITNKGNENIKARNQTFSKELSQLKEYFHIPGLAVIVKNGSQTVYENYLGFADLANQVTMDSVTTVPMASLTKIFTGILMMQLVEEGKISLDEPINKYSTDQNIPDSIKIKHVLSHTSQGNLGQHFYYSGRFGWLTSVIEKAHKASFEDVIMEKIIGPLELKNTFLLKDSSRTFNGKRKIAQPYLFDGEIKGGFIDYGYSASAGLTSTIRDLAIFSEALDKNILINEQSKSVMFAPFKKGLEYGFGVFSQEFQNKKLVWAYGQYDCYSSLFLKVPEKQLSFIIAANNNLISDPARLIYGDITYSLFALSFLKNFVFEQSGVLILEDEDSLNTLVNRVNGNNSTFYRKKLIAQSIAESFMGMFDTSRTEKSKNILRRLFTIFPDYDAYGDLTLLHNLTILKSIAQNTGQSDFIDFDTQLETIGKKLLTIDSSNPYANYYFADYYLGKGAIDSTAQYYDRIINAGNYSRNWYTTEAENWIKKKRRSNQRQ
jgi:CubicO group peptidase (beta-lactamase class C family)